MTGSGTIRIDRPFDELAELLSARPSPWAEPFLRIAAHTGEAAAGRSVGEAVTPGSKQLSVELLAAVAGDDPDELVVPVRWRTAGFQWVPPAYAGRIVVRRIAPEACEMELDGSYALPDTARNSADAAAASVAAEATVLTFLRSFRDAVEEQARQIV